METVKLGKKGQMSIPKGILKRLGLEGDVTLFVDTTPEGAIVLRPAAVYPIEIYIVGEPSQAATQLAIARGLPGKDVPILAAAINSEINKNVCCHSQSPASTASFAR